MSKKIFGAVIFFFTIGFISLCQHMGLIRLGYVLSREKTAHKELSNLNRSLYFEKTSLKSPRHLGKVACGNLGLNIGAGVKVRKISIVSTAKKFKKEDKIAGKLAGFFGFNSKAIAKPSH